MVAEHEEGRLPSLLSPREVARETGLSIWTIRRSMQEGIIPTVRISRRAIRVPRGFVEALAEGRVEYSAE